MSDPVIRTISARRIWDSRGRPTVEAEVALSDGAVGRGMAPAGASRGAHEAVDKRDGGKRLGGLDVQTALEGIRAEIAPALIGLDPFDQAGDRREARRARRHAEQGPARRERADRGFAWRSSRGGGEPRSSALALLPRRQRRPIIPLPEIQIFGGGAHAGRRTDIQDFMVVAPRAKTFAEALGGHGGSLPRRRSDDGRARPLAGRRR